MPHLANTGTTKVKREELTSSLLQKIGASSSSEMVTVLLCTGRHVRRFTEGSMENGSSAQDNESLAPAFHFRLEIQRTVGDIYEGNILSIGLEIQRSSRVCHFLQKLSKTFMRIIHFFGLWPKPVETAKNSS